MSLYEWLRLAAGAVVIAVVAFVAITIMCSFFISADVDRRTGHDELDDDQWQ